jgi:hypothetical protein
MDASRGNPNMSLNQTGMLDEAISGSLLTLLLFDVSDEIRLDELRQVLNAPASARQLAFPATCARVRTVCQPPMLEFVEGLTLSGELWVGGRIALRLRSGQRQDVELTFLFRGIR